jgi:hypothetical protein
LLSASKDFQGQSYHQLQKVFPWSYSKRRSWFPKGKLSNQSNRFPLHELSNSP